MYGDCFRACIASLLEMEAHEVPHFFGLAPNTNDAWLIADKFLEAHGLATAFIYFDGKLPIEHVLTTMAVTNPNIYYMLAGKSRNMTGHIVIGLNDAIVHDPSGNGIVAPQALGDAGELIYTVILLVSAKLRATLK